MAAKKVDKQQLLEMFKQGKSQAEAASFFGVSRQAISLRVRDLITQGLPLESKRSKQRKIDAERVIRLEKEIYRLKSRAAAQAEEIRILREERPQWDDERIRALRRHLNLTQRELAERLGTRQQTISEWELGMYQPRGASSTLLSIVAERAKFKYEVTPAAEKPEKP